MTISPAAAALYINEANKRINENMKKIEAERRRLDLKPGESLLAAWKREDDMRESVVEAPVVSS